jgi:6-phosphogluconate dehydrogenase
MQLGLVGLGKMGGNMRTRVRDAGHTVIGYDHDQEISDATSLADARRHHRARRPPRRG